jgi:hypothetical protein
VSQAVVPPADQADAAVAPKRKANRGRKVGRSDEKIQLRLTITRSMGAWRVLMAANDADRRFLAYTLLEYGTDAKEGLRTGGFAVRHAEPGPVAASGETLASATASAKPATNVADPVRTEEVPSDVAEMVFGDFAPDPPVLAVH